MVIAVATAVTTLPCYLLFFVPCSLFLVPFESKYDVLTDMSVAITGDIAKHLVMGIGKVTPTSKDSFGFTPLGRKEYKSCKTEDLRPIYKKDGYEYSFL
ncbi:MAG: hypothetical protein F6K58_23695 [Symploca sp. SIO2E9]|nr:hypothetical protein [Symploca sp. SIO2E9]